MKIQQFFTVAVVALVGCRDEPSGVGSGTETDGMPTATESGDTTTPDTDSETETGSDTLDPGEVDFEPAEGGLRKLLFREYRDSVELMLGPEAGAAADPPTDNPEEGFDAVGAWKLSLGSVDIEDYEDSAAAAADAAIANKTVLAETVPCVMGGGAGCFESVARDFGRLAFRRTLEDVEVDQLVEIATAGRDHGGNFDSGLRYELLAILQAPSFLYISAVGEPDEGSGYRVLTPTELAARMAFFLTGKTPTVAMLDMAEAGELDSEAAIRELGTELVQDPGAKVAIAAFFDEALRTRSVPDAPKNTETFPNFTPELGEFMRQETLLLVYDIVWNRDADYRELFSADYTFINDPLADLYGMPSPGMGNQFMPVDWPANQNRAGYTSQASFLTWQSGTKENSPTKRGKYVQSHILCNKIPPPDPSVDPTLPDDEDLTLKELLEMHMNNPGCVTCHGLTDPIGFAYEGFDAIGQHRTMDNGRPVETDGSISGIGEWENAKELGQVLAEDPRTSACLINNLVKGMLGHTPTNGEQPAIDELDIAFADASYSVQSLMVEFVSHPLFRVVNEPK